MEFIVDILNCYLLIGFSRIINFLYYVFLAWFLNFFFNFLWYLEEDYDLILRICFRVLEEERVRDKNLRRGEKVLGMLRG